MTSNIGSDIILQAKKIDESVKEQIEKLLHKAFRPEFLNRIDEIVFFNMLTPEILKNITQVQLKKFEQRMQARQVTTVISNAAINFIAQEGFEPEFGARPLKRAIHQHIVVPTSQYLLQHPETKELSIDYKNSKIVIK